MLILLESKHDQNINRVFPKMSEGCSGRNFNNTKISNVEKLHFINNIGTSDKVIDLNSSYDHVYASNSGIVLPLPDISKNNCQNAESEVKFLREWLLLHLDLIQQQNDEILSKEKTISMLKQENEMLKEHLNALQKGICSQPEIIGHSSIENILSDTNIKVKEISNSVNEEKEKVPIITLSDKTDLLSVQNFDSSGNKELLDNNCFPEINVINKNLSGTVSCENIPVNQDKEHKESDQIIIRSDSLISSQSNDSFDNKIFLDDSVTQDSIDDSLKSIRMSIRRKRLCSNSSVLSNNDSLEEKNSSRKLRKKRKNSLKNDKILLCSEHYLTQTGEVNIPLLEPELPNEFTRSTNLEVPQWRVKVYTSCYSMEGTENLDDEVYNKRHLKHENDERRRKRWDVQRIREQRIVEKLKQRQERVGSGSKGDELSEPVQSLWSLPEDIKYLEICDQLPVSALGAVLPRLVSSEFSLPWLNNSHPHTTTKRNSTRRSIVRRKSTKR